MMSIAFFFLGSMKIISLVESGLEPYESFARQSGLPEYFKYYVLLALTIEFYFAVGVWFSKTFTGAIWAALSLAIAGAGYSVYSLIFKIYSDCGCGLLGDSEYGLLAQKLIIVAALALLYGNQSALFGQTMQPYAVNKRPYAKDER